MPRGSGRRCLIGLLAVLSGLGTFVTLPASASRSAPVQTVWARYHFHSNRSGLLVIDGTAAVGPGSYIADVQVFGGAPSQQVAEGDVFDIPDFRRVGTYGAIGNRGICAAPVTCSVQQGTLGFGVTYDIQGDGKHPLDVRLYLAIRGSDIHIHDKALEGWTAVHRVGGVERLTDESAGGLGVEAAGSTAGVNTGVSAPGPAGGSVAVAVPACDDFGAGLLSLSGGRTTQTAICPTSTIAAAAPGKTTWTASGAVIGASSNTTRLLVLRA